VSARFLVAALLFGFCANLIADTFPIIDVRYGYLIGAIESGTWLESNDAISSVKAGVRLPVYGVTGKVGIVEVLKAATQDEPCPDRPVVKVRPTKMAKGVIAFLPNWNPLPRTPKSVDVH
jgi:hypothetical protein